MSFLKDLAAIAVLVTGLLYYIGYIGITARIGKYGLDASIMGLTVPDVMIQGVLTIELVWGSSATYIMGIVVLLILVPPLVVEYVLNKHPRSRAGYVIRTLTTGYKTSPSPGILSWIILILLLLFEGSQMIMGLVANAEGPETTAIVHIVWKRSDKPQEHDKLLLDADQKCQLRIIFQNKDLIGVSAGDKSHLTVTFLISRADIESISTASPLTCVFPN